MPNRFTLCRWDEKFAETGSVERKKSEKKKTVTTPETIQAVEKVFTDKNMSIRRAGTGLGISIGTVHKILHKDLKFHPYTLQLLQELKQNDKEKQVKLVEEQLDLIENDPDFIKKKFLLRRSTFYLHDGVNRHDYCY